MVMDEAYFVDILREKKQQDLYRSRLIHDSPQSPLLTINNKQYLSFCSNDYLGLANNSEIKQSLIDAANVYGVGSGASHLISGHHVVHEQLEQQLATITKRSKALVFANGYMANIAIVNTLLQPKDAVFIDRLNHASIYDACMLTKAKIYRYQHKCMASLEKKLQSSTEKRKLIITDSVFSMDGDIAPILSLVKLAKQYGALLAVDDAHGFGVLGNTGAGIAELYNCSQQDIPILMGTFGKALGTYGAFIAGSSNLIDVFIQQARPYIYTTALPPAIAKATLTSLHLVTTGHERRQHLKELISEFKHGCKKFNIKTLESSTAIQPIIMKDSKKAVFFSEKLKEMGIIVKAIRPPTVPVGTARLRITLSYLHTKPQIHRLLVALNAINVKFQLIGDA
jgi:8-amino-7-oxononanoate synthase